MQEQLPELSIQDQYLPRDRFKSNYRSSKYNNIKGLVQEQLLEQSIEEQ